MRSEPITIDPVRSVSGRAVPVRLVAALVPLLLAAPAAFAQPAPESAGAPDARAAADSSIAVAANDGPALRLRIAAGESASSAGEARSRTILAAAAETLRVSREIGLGAPADDGNGEIDIVLTTGAARLDGRVVIDPRSVNGRVAAGRIEIDDDARRPARELRAVVARTVARLVLAGRDRMAPAWWTEPTVLWIETEVAGEGAGLAAATRARFERPETGITTDDLLLAAGNVALIHSLGDDALEGRLLSESWSRLGSRDWTSDPLSAVDAASRSVTGLSLEGLLLRAAVVRTASGALPARFAIDSPPIPATGVTSETAVAPLGAALVRLRPDARATAATEIEIGPADGTWTFELLLERRDAGWERLRLGGPAAAAPRLLLPWRDYRQAVLIATRGSDAPGAGLLEVSARSGGALEPYALSSFGGRRAPDGQVEIAWSTAWERELFGWLVERSSGPAGPWRPIQEIPVPALGLPDEGTGYALIDRAAPDDDPTWYRVVGITAAGLRVSGPGFAIGGAR